MGKKFEYKVVWIYSYEDLEENLNALGQMGWEMCAIDTHIGEAQRWQVYLKRELHV